jgi:hypothetical protein
MDKESFKDFLTDIIKNVELKSKTETNWDHHKSEDRTTTWYWDDIKHDWYFKDDAIRSKIIKKLRPMIDEVMEENKDFIKFFL